MKRKIILFLMMFLLVSCGTPDNSKNKAKKVEDILETITNNYSVNYSSSRGKYNIYKTENYIYDEELKGGQFVLEDETMYIYTLHNNVVVPRVPYYGFKEDFEMAYPSFKFDIEKFDIEKGVYTTTDIETVESLSLFINSTGYAKASLFMDGGLLNFRFYNQNDKVEVTGKIYSINSTSFAPVKSYLDSKIDPELDTYENQPLVNALKYLNDNFTFIGQNNTTNEGLALLVNEDYVASFVGTKEDKEDLFGYVALEDGTHYFQIMEDTLSVDFEISAGKDFIKENYGFKRHDYTKFKDIGDNTYVSSDFYNVRNFAELLTLDGSQCNLVRLKINSTDSIQIDLMYNDYAVYSGEIYDIESSSIEQLTKYVNGEVKPDLPKYENATLLEATKDLGSNFTYVNETQEVEEGNFLGIYSTENGRKEYKSEYNNFPSTDYISYEDYAFAYVLDENKVSPKYYDYLTKAEYDSLYSFKAIDFSCFKPMEENKWMTNSLKYINTLSKLLGSNPYQNYHFQATVEILDDGRLYFEIMDSYLDVNTKGYLKDINTTTISIIDDYNKTNSKPSKPNNDNSELVPYINALKNNNFTTKYHDDPAYDMYFDETDYDYWTEDTVYMGTYEAGFITSTKSKYMYEYAMITDDETNVEYLAINTHPSLYISSIADYNPFNKFDEEKINALIPYEDGYISFDNDIIEIAIEALCLQDVLSLISFAGVIIKIENDSLVISIFDEIKVTYDENNKRHEEYVIFATASFINVGTTTIPDFAIVPSIK